MIASMAVGRANHPRRRLLDALFGEARELERRRRRRYLFVALFVCIAAAAGGWGLRSGSRGSAAAVGSRVVISSGALPAGGHYAGLEAVGGRLIVTGRYGYWSTGTCNSATVDPLSLRVLSVTRGSCADPAVYGQRVSPVRYLLRTITPAMGLNTIALRIATVAPHARHGYRLGPIVVRYPQCSDCGIEWIYGDGALWLYAPLASPRAVNTGELFRISERTGRVLQHWPMPTFTRGLLAVDGDGVWIAQSLFGGEPAHVPAGQRIDYHSLYRVAPGMRSPQRALDLRTWGANWLVAAGHSVWLDVAENRGPSRLWRLDGPTAAPAIRARALPNDWDCVQMGEGSTTIAGSGAAGIYCVGGGPLRLRSVDPATGAAHALPDPGFAGGPAVASSGSVFFLPSGPSGWATRVYRVTPSGP